MKKALTEIVFILDKSGSMEGLERDTIGGFNSMIKKQKKEEGEALISTILFNSTSQVIHDRVELKQIALLTRADYICEGTTALLDAVGGAIHHIKTVHRYIKREDVPEKTLFIITTDGYENASRHYSYSKIKEMISVQKEKGWDFLFLGANIDAIAEANKFGLNQDYAVNYRCDSQGTSLNYDVICETVSEFRKSSKGVDKSWKERIEQANKMQD